MFRRYFADNVRDDYAAGQLDAQVFLYAFDHIYLEFNSL
jgi:hypothetical protein